MTLLELLEKNVTGKVVTIDCGNESYTGILMVIDDEVLHLKTIFHHHEEGSGKKHSRLAITVLDVGCITAFTINPFAEEYAAKIHKLEKEEQKKKMKDGTKILEGGKGLTC